MRKIVGILLITLLFGAYMLLPKSLLAQAPVAPFGEITASAGIYGSFAQPGKEMGQAVGDVNNDGWLDVYLVNHQGPNRLYLGQGLDEAGMVTFQRAPLSYDVALPNHPSGDAVFVDFDNDGWRDLYVIGMGPNVLLRNLHGRGFQDVTKIAGVAGDAMSRGATWGDYDNDGWLDLYVVNWACYPLCGRPFLGERDRLYHNEGLDAHGNISFRDVSDLLGVKTMGAGFVANFLDVDDDGDLDLYLVNDEFIHPIGNVLWRNDGPGAKSESDSGQKRICDGWCFSEITADANAGAKVMGMGLAAGDYDNDGDSDLFFTNAGPMQLLQNPLRQNELAQGIAGQFQNSADAAGALVAEGIGWSATFLDVDNDGWQDLFVAVDKSTRGPVLGSSLLRNQGDGTFAPMSSQVEASGQTISSTAADFDNDGWVDLLVGNHQSGYHLYGNLGGADPDSSASANWISVSLSGGGPVNHDAIGTRVTLTLPNGTMQSQQLIRATSLGADSGSILHFGLGDQTTATLTIRWPDGTERVMEGVAGGALVEVGY